MLQNIRPTAGVIHPPLWRVPLLLIFNFSSVPQTHITHSLRAAVTMVSRPRVSSMRKKMIAQKGDRGSLVRASGYTTKAMPGPVDNTRSLRKKVNHHTHACTHADTLAWFSRVTFGVSPSSATCSMGTFNSCAMNPMTEKMTKPANILVALFVHVTIIVSLQGKNNKKRNN